MILLVLFLVGAAVEAQLPCGYTPITQSRVIAGQDATPGAWPWQIALKRNGRFICGGSLISADWVVTAAHCVAGSSNPSNYQVVVGDHNRNTNEGTEQTVGAKRIISHSSYNNPRLSSDIALIELAQAVTLSRRVNPICLPSSDSDVPTGTTCYITGWGKIRHPGSSHPILQQAMMPPIDNQKCSQKIQASGVSISLTPQMLCAGVENTPVSGCHGDSGGPYVCVGSNNTYTLHGAVSWGSGSCNANQLFTVFARVTQFRAWIKQHTNIDGGGGGTPLPPTPPIPSTPPIPTTQGNLVFSCDFDTDMCGFTQSSSDQFDWTRNFGSTGSSQTGPSADVSGSGRYVYIETSSPRKLGDTAILEKPLPVVGTYCLSFYYHMYGASMGRLTVKVGQQTVFTKSGDQGNKWTKADVIINVPGNTKLVFEGVTGSSYQGDAAIDNVEVKNCGGGGTTLPPIPSTLPPTPPPPSTPPIPTTQGNLEFSCNFDADFCGFTQSSSDQFDWTRNSGSTGSISTGPSGDVSGSGQYAYIETSSPRKQGDTARLVKSGLSFNGRKCLSFYYHMYGASMGSLSVSVGQKTVFSKSGDQGNQWMKASVTIDEPGASTLVFVGVTGSSYQGDAAIDNVELRNCGGGGTPLPPTPPGGGDGCTSGPPPVTTSPPATTTPPHTTVATPPPPQSFTCNFDQDLCGFAQDSSDDFDWARNRGGTPSVGTGPSSDYTSGNGSYMYIETSSPRVQGDVARLVSAPLYFSGQMCLKFYLHMYGSGMGSLVVKVRGKPVLSLRGDQGNLWTEKRIDENYAPGNYQVTFEGIRGSDYRSDIAIDDFSLTAGSCSGGGTTPSPTTTGTPPPPGSCGIRPQTRIVGGTAAKHGDWPWQVQLRTTSGFPYCGGSLVAPNWVVTATHCVTGKSPSSIIVRAGAHRRTSNVGTEQDFQVTKVITHPSYHSPKRYSHDIALLKLASPAQLNKNVNLVCLPDNVPAPTDGTRCWITGWGRLSSGGATPDILQQVSVPIRSRARCDASYPGKIHDSMICAGQDQGGIDSCQGDSGGPMVCETGGRFYLHGATSWGYGCASPGKFGVYAKVTFLLPWLKQEMSSN